MSDSVHPVRLIRRAKQPPVTLEALADAIGTTKASLSRIENGKQTLTPAMASKLAKALGVKPALVAPELAEFAGGAQE